MECRRLAPKAQAIHSRSERTMIGNLHFGSAVTAAFLASLVEAVEALTIVLAVAVVRGWRPAGLGALAGLVTLALVVVALGPLLDRIPLEVLQLVVGVLLLLFGMRWLRKAILRAGGIIPLRDETAAFSSETVELRDAERQHEPYLDWIAGLASFKAVLLEGLEVVFIVIAVTAGRGALVPVSVAALTACLIVAAVGLFVHRPLTRVPANVLKFAVGVMLSAFGLFWRLERALELLGRVRTFQSLPLSLYSLQPDSSQPPPFEVVARSSRHEDVYRHRSGTGRILH